VEACGHYQTAHFLPRVGCIHLTHYYCSRSKMIREQGLYLEKLNEKNEKVSKKW
jgi:hypothetical protein